MTGFRKAEGVAWNADGSTFNNVTLFAEGEGWNDGATVGLAGGGYKPAKPPKRGEQGELFSVEHPIIHSLAATRGSEHHVMTLLGIAHNLSVSQFGVAPVADKELSPDSHRIVKRIAKVPGMLAEPPIDKPNNPAVSDEDRKRWVEKKLFESKVGEVMSEADVNAGRATARKAVNALYEDRKSAKAKAAPKPAPHPTLPGM